MRVQKQIDRIIEGETSEHREQRIEAAKQWGEWVLSVGDGTVPNPVQIPPRIHMPGNNVQDLINWVYPDVASMTDPEMLKARAILALRNQTIDEINRIVTERHPGTVEHPNSRIYPSTDW